MELPPTHPETSMWQDTPMEDWMVIPMQATVTSSNLIEQTCPRGKKANIIIINIISWLLPYYKRWWRRVGDENFTFSPNPSLTSQSVGITDDETSKDCN